MLIQKTKTVRVITSLLVLGAFLTSPLGAGIAFAQDGMDPAVTVPAPGTGSTIAQNNTSQQQAQSQINTMNAMVSNTTTQHSNHGNPLKDFEHDELFEQVDPSLATYIVTQNASWTDLINQGVVKDGARLVIEEGVTVNIDSQSDVKVDWIHVKGTLSFDTDKDTRINVVTLVTDTKSKLLIGTASNPIQSGFKAEIVVAARSAQAKDADLIDIMGGIITHGHVEIYGADIQDYSLAVQSPKAGDTELVLSQPATGWKVGDHLILAGANPNAVEDEELTVTGISSDGMHVSFARIGDTSATNNALKFDHDNQIPIGNLTRNVVIKSENADGPLSDRGHVMFMHNADVHVYNASFVGLGRTDARKAVTDPEIDANGMPVAGTRDNTRGRYAVHFHMRDSADITKPPAEFIGNVVVDSPKFGIVNHGGYVKIESNVTYDIDGSHIFLENGSEIGTVIGNVMIRSRGNGFWWTDPSDPAAKPKFIRDGQESRKEIFDFGFLGHALWSQGGGVTVTDNFAAGHEDMAYIFFTTTIKEGGKAVQFKVANLPAGDLKDYYTSKGITSIDVSLVPFTFARNKATASRGGFESKFHNLGQKVDTARSLVADSVFWGNKGGTSIAYTNQLTFRNVQVIGDLTNPRGTAFSRNDVTKSITWENVRVEGWGVGIMIPVNGQNYVIGGTFNNGVSIQITTTNMKGRVVHIDTTGLVWGTLTAAAMKKAGITQQYDISLKANFNPKMGDITKLFLNDAITASGDDVRINGMQIYYEEQAANYVPFKQVFDAKGKLVSDTTTGTALDGMTNAEIWATYNMALGGVVAPPGTLTDPRIKGLIGAPSVYQADLNLTSKTFTNQSIYVPQVKDLQGKTVQGASATLVANSWNIVPVGMVDGVLRHTLVYYDTIPPTFVPDANLPKAINPIDLPYGILITGKILDQIGRINTAENFEMIFKPAKDPANPKKGEFVLSADGQSVILNFSVKDQAGNVTPVTITMLIDPNAPIRRGNIGAFKQPSFGKDVPLRLLKSVTKMIIWGLPGLLR